MSMSLLTSLEQLTFDNQFVNKLPADKNQTKTPRQVINAAYSLVEPTPVKQPELISYSKEVAELLNLSTEACNSELFTQVFVGNQLLTPMQPFAMCYGGHQFGHWAGQLGDGRAINLGEALTPTGHQTLQLKGAGLTPYSRTADGLAVLRSSIREYLCSEAMYHLGVPTTRALSIVLTGEEVVRDMFYDGNPEYEPTAVVCRVAPSFMRFGNFQLATQRGDLQLLKQLAEHTIKRDFNHLLTAGEEPTAKTYVAWFKEISESTAQMVCHWMRVGFVHGVMNTDNLSILGLTIDYGPYGWLENYDPSWTPNTTDASGRRYCYGNQPKIAQWNLYQLANAIVPLIGETSELEKILNDFVDYYQNLWLNTLAQKVGFDAYVDSEHNELLEELLTLLPMVETDMTIFFRKLANVEKHRDYQKGERIKIIEEAYYNLDSHDKKYTKRMKKWLKAYQLMLAKQPQSDKERKAQMNSINPKYVMRNYLAQKAIDLAHTGDYTLVNGLLDVMRKPYDEQPDKESFAAKRPEWARVKPGCSMLSCSS